MRADIAISDDAEQGVGQCVQPNICIAMADKRLWMRNADTTQRNRIARAEGMDIVP